MKFQNNRNRTLFIFVFNHVDAFTALQRLIRPSNDMIIPIRPVHMQMDKGGAEIALTLDRLSKSRLSSITPQQPTGLLSLLFQHLAKATVTVTIFFSMTR